MSSFCTNFCLVKFCWFFAINVTLILLTISDSRWFTVGRDAQCFWVIFSVWNNNSRGKFDISFSIYQELFSFTILPPPHLILCCVLSNFNKGICWCFVIFIICYLFCRLRVMKCMSIQDRHISSFCILLLVPFGKSPGKRYSIHASNSVMLLGLDSF